MTQPPKQMIPLLLPEIVQPKEAEMIPPQHPEMIPPKHLEIVQIFPPTMTMQITVKLFFLSCTKPFLQTKKKIDWQKDS
jgi:hypothetical protein